MQKNIGNKIKVFKVQCIHKGSGIELTSTVAPFLVPIIVGCQGAPSSLVVSSRTAVVTTPFVDEWESTTIAIGSPLST